jgi:hypothetical protein
MPKKKRERHYLVRGQATVRFEVRITAESREDAEQAAHDIGAEELAQDHAVDAIDTDVDEVEPVED